jgi:SAM-dependent methyltransferase
VALRWLDEDPDWDGVGRMTFVCLLPEGAVALRPDRRLPSGTLADGEHPLDGCLRIPLDQAGFRYQRFHALALDGDHLVGWATGDRHHATAVPATVGTPADAAEAALAARAVADHAASPDEAYFRDNVRTLQRAYLRAATPQGGSGFGGDLAQWRARRQQVADAVPGDGTFLDVGCANGFLVESVVAWCAERGVHVEPYGIDLAPEVVALARRRLPQWAGRFRVGNALDWVDPDGRRFDVVHVLLDAVPPARRAALLAHHLTATVAPGGRLLVGDYAARTEPRTDAVLRELGVEPAGWLPSRDRARPSPGLAWAVAP